MYVVFAEVCNRDEGVGMVGTTHGEAGEMACPMGGYLLKRHIELLQQRVPVDDAGAVVLTLECHEKEEKHVRLMKSQTHNKVTYYSIYSYSHIHPQFFLFYVCYLCYLLPKLSPAYIRMGEKYLLS